LTFVLATATPARAQVHQRRELVRPHHRHRGVPKPSRRPRAAPPRAHATTAESSAPPTATQADAWTADRAHLILSAESLLGISAFRNSHSATTSFGTAKVVESGASVHLLKGAELVVPFDQARVGLDAVVGPGLTLGAGVGYATVGGESELTSDIPNGEVTNESLTRLTVFVLVPRVGYMLAVNRHLAIWLRAGAGYASIHLENDDSGDEQTLSSWDLVVDPMLVVSPLPHLGLLVGPSLNFGLTGNVSIDDPNPAILDRSYTASSYGVNAGLALLF
jgi:hypothetical protein